MKYCYEIFNGPRSLEDRRMAVELVQVVADHRALSWVAEFLDDEDSHIQVWGVGVLDQLLWSHLIEPEAAEDLLRSYVVKKYPDSAHCGPSTPSTFISISPVCCACVVKQ
jgi:hypothetical protein